MIKCKDTTIPGLRVSGHWRVSVNCCHLHMDGRVLCVAVLETVFL